MSEFEAKKLLAASLGITTDMIDRAQQIRLRSPHLFHAMGMGFITIEQVETVIRDLDRRAMEGNG